MCLQCVTDAVIIKNGIIPGYTLMKAAKSCDEWKEGQYGLVNSNDPDFIWDNPGPDPTADMNDEQIDNLPLEIFRPTP